MKLAHIRQHVISEIISLINSEEVQSDLSKNKEFNFLDELCVLKTDPLPEDKALHPNIAYFEIRHRLQIGMTIERVPTHFMQLQRTKQPFTEGGSPLDTTPRITVSFSTIVPSKFSNPQNIKKMVFNYNIERNGPRERFAVMTEIDLTYIQENILFRLPEGKK